MTDHRHISREQQSPAAPSRRTMVVKTSAFLILVAGIVLLVVLFEDQFTAQNILAYQETLDRVQARQPVLVYGGALLAYVFVTGLSLPGAAIMSLIYGSVFGFVRTLIIVSFASTAGATVAFLTSRYLLRDAVQSKFGRYLNGFNDALQREGAFYLFTLRLIPAVPFFVINLVMGLTPMRTRTFWWVSQIGMFPGTCVYVYAGSTLSLEAISTQGVAGILKLETILAFAVLGVFPLAVKKFMSHWRARDA